MQICNTKAANRLPLTRNHALAGDMWVGRKIVINDTEVVVPYGCGIRSGWHITDWRKASRQCSIATVLAALLKPSDLMARLDLQVR